MIHKFFVVVMGILVSLPITLKAMSPNESGVLSMVGKDSVPYISKNVRYYNADSSIRFGATLTIPNNHGRKPAVILVSGTGKQDRNGTMAGHKMFATIADYLTRNGIIVLRVDDRGEGETTGVYETSTTGDFAADVLTSIHFLKGCTEVDLKKIGLIGHSEGGAVISIVAAQSKDVAFMVSIAGLAMNGLDALRKQNADLVASSALPNYDKARSNDINERMFQTAYDYANSDSMEQKLNSVYAEWKKKDDVYFKTLNVTFDHFRFPVYSYVRTAVGPWYRYFIQYDPAKYLTKIKIPVLALNGDKDLMVSCNENLAHFEKYLGQAGNKDYKTVVMPGLNHLLLHCNECTQAEYATIKESIAPEVLIWMGNWILDHVNGRKH